VGVFLPARAGGLLRDLSISGFAGAGFFSAKGTENNSIGEQRAEV
jgi:hypothetical protein